MHPLYGGLEVECVRIVGVALHQPLEDEIVVVKTGGVVRCYDGQCVERFLECNHCGQRTHILFDETLDIFLLQAAFGHID